MNKITENINKNEENNIESQLQKIEEISNLEENQEKENEIEKLKDQLLRSIAENENIRKRYEKQIDEIKNYAISNLAKDLILVMDNLSMALEHKPKDYNEEINNIIKGVQLTKDELEKIFIKYNIEKVFPNKGDKFNYDVHHVISEKETDIYETGAIVDILQVGYKIKDRLLRAALVSLARNNK